MILEQLAGLLNRNVAMSTRAQELVQRLEARSLAIQVEGLPLNVVASIQSGRLALTNESDAAADATVSGTPLTLLSLAGADARVRLRSSAVTIDGDAEIAEAFQELLRAVRPDFEEELSRHVGDVAAHQVGNTVRGFTGWGRKAAQTFAANVGEYLQEEGRDLVTRTEMDEFLAEVDQLREAADRLEARMTRLARRATR
ncbi:MAG TPA: SCP2 sterol-binding domain-containing protein [Steroidobacteraceae bacterium]|nr:SCP2 sterol-binding domain-containing protein [Steroidobacteraceae bacterium]